MHKRFIGEKLMESSQSIPDLNPIKNLWSIVKMKLCEGDKQYNCKANLSKAIKTTMLENEPAELKQLRKSIDNRFLVVTKKKNHYI